MSKYINTGKLPEGYEITTDSETGKYGITCTKKVGEVVVLEPKYCVATVFKSYGKVLLAYKENEDDLYTISNRSGSLKLSAVDFLAGGNYVYLKHAGVYSTDDYEWTMLNAQLEMVKNIGVLELNDSFTRNGERILTVTKDSVDMLDRYGKTCRLTLRNGSVDEVITFGKSAKVKDANREVSDPFEEAQWWDFEFNITSGEVRMQSSEGHRMSVNKFNKLGLSELRVIFKDKPSIEIKDVKVRKVKKECEVATFFQVEKSLAVKIYELLKCFVENTPFSKVEYLLNTYGAEYCLGKFRNDFSKLCIDTENEIDYKYLVVNASMNFTVFVMNSVGKISYVEIEKPIELAEHNLTEIKTELLEGMYKKLEDPHEFGVPVKPLTLMHKYSYTGNRIGDSWYDGACVCGLGITQGKATMQVSLFVLDKFSYESFQTTKAEKERAVGNLNNREAHTMKYNEKRLTLSTKTNLFGLLAEVDRVEWRL